MAVGRFSFFILVVAVFSLAMAPVSGSVAATSQSSKSTASTVSASKSSSTSKSSSSQTSSKSSSSKSSSSKSSKSSSSATNEALYAALVVNADNGQVLYEKNAGSTRYPASLTKMMTLYLTFDALKRGKIKLTDSMKVSEKAASQPQTNISLKKGGLLPVQAAIESLVVRSANDAAMVLAEALGGTEWNFAMMMTKKARELGMKDTVFRNPSGLPDDKQYTNAFDMARLAIALRRDFPEYYHFFQRTSFTWNGITYPGHNNVMKNYPGADGIKTGYIRASGYNLVTSATRNGHRVVAVVMGGSSAASRDKQMTGLLDRTFAALEQTERSVAQDTATTGKNPTLEAYNTYPVHAYPTVQLRATAR